MPWLKVTAVDNAIGYTSDGRARRVSYKNGMVIGYLNTALNNSLFNWINVNTPGGMIAFNGTKGIAIDKATTAKPPSYVYNDKNAYKPKYDWNNKGKGTSSKRSVFTSEKPSTLQFGLAINGSGNGGQGSGISIGGGDPDGKDYTKYYLIGGLILIILLR